MRRIDRRRRVAGMGVALCLSLAAGACAGDPSPASSPVSPSPEDAPRAASASATAPSAPSADAEQVLSVGAFERIGYDGEGEATVVDTGDGVEIRFSDFRVERGPALRVYLSAARAGAEAGAYDDDFIDLGVLEAFRGDQTYFVPSSIDLADFRSVVIWCEEFSVGFVVAPIRVD